MEFVTHFNIVLLRLIFSDSCGHLSLWRVGAAGNVMTELATWRGHQFEAWSAYFNIWNQNIMYSGADDCSFCGWDEREGWDKSIFTVKHDMGVCSIRHHPSLEHLISTGSFDGSLRVWDLRMLHSQDKSVRYLPSSMFKISGGVWRHKWGPFNLILIAGVHAGFVITKLIPEGDSTTDDNTDPDLLHVVRATNNNLAYGVDWDVMDTLNCSYVHATVASCSFYDNQVNFDLVTIHSQAVV